MKLYCMKFLFFLLKNAIIKTKENPVKRATLPGKP